ncbi:MAG: BaiN/RdsA family NAD(P)/FAD-dependent oxidoreductase [Bacteroidia bacterium]
MIKKSVAIIGSGPTALMLAATLDKKLFEVTIYEKNAAPARKFLVASDGGFNLTHSEEVEQFISRYTPPSFLEKSIRSFTNTDLCHWLKQIGIDTYTGSSKRIFPMNGVKPIDVLNAILGELKSKNVQVKTKHQWKGWNTRNELIMLHDDTETFVKADIVVFALGGASWHKTGSDGSWINLFEEKGVEIVPFQASNCACQIKWDEKFLKQAEGKVLKNISIACEGIEKRGEVVITKFGIEGGAIYALSPQIRKQLNASASATIFIDLKPSFTKEAIKSKLINKGDKTLTLVLKNDLNFSPAQLTLLKSSLTKDCFINTDTLAATIKSLPLTLTAMAPIEEAISTVGGIALQEVDDCFQLRKIPNHYAIGEMLDWDAPTGGYLLQACFSMGAYVGKILI